MEKFIIKGGIPLRGEVRISGAKNAAVAIIPAAILAEDKCILENVPSISDVDVALEILSSMGAQIRRLSKSRPADLFHAPDPHRTYLPEIHTRRCCC